MKACESGRVSKFIRVGDIYTIIVVGKHKIMYANLSECILASGDKIKQSQIIGRVPQTGYELSNAYVDILVNSLEDSRSVAMDSIWRRHIKYK